MQVSLDNKTAQKQTGYYHSKSTDMDLYLKLKDKYKYYIPDEMLEMCTNEFHTQVKEGMNICISRYAPKTRT